MWGITPKHGQKSISPSMITEHAIGGIVGLKV